MSFEPKARIESLQKEVDAALANFIADEARYLGQIGSELDPVATALTKFLLDGGKRIRPLFALIGYLGTGEELDAHSITALSSLELVHVCALIHDDVMDGSDTRRGAPSIHKLFEQIHRNEKLTGSADQYGLASAILIGDLALILSAKMLHDSQAPAKSILRSLSVYDEMRIELMAGQFLDIHEQALASESLARSLKVARYKSAKYSIERPLHFGATLASENSEKLVETYSAYGLPMGEAFQMRDDVLGVFGNPVATGKPAGDDLREGKRTVLMATTMARVTVEQRQTMKELFGKSDLSATEIETIRSIITDTGALAETEMRIENLTKQALAAIKNGAINADAQSMLVIMASLVTQRTV